LSKARGRGLSVIDAISLALGGKLDQSVIAEARLDLAERYAERLLEVARRAVEGLSEERGARGGPDEQLRR
jgi:hypothetical protein